MSNLHEKAGQVFLEVTGGVSIFKTVTGGICGVLAYVFGGFDMALKVLVTIVAIDYATGFLAAIHSKELSSRTGLIGIVKKVGVFLLVALANMLQSYMGGVFPIREFVITFFIANEGLSILENVGEMGIPIPEKMKAVLHQLKQGKDTEE